ncbi:MAG TPA: hypothetical protein GXX40_02515 [Firmicutes bacterium]|nr:hypothetical protein [Bacillota bacterium]
MFAEDTKVLPAEEQVTDERGKAVKRITKRLIAMHVRVVRVIGQARQVNTGHKSLPDCLVSVFDPMPGRFHAGGWNAQLSLATKLV